MRNQKKKTVFKSRLTAVLFGEESFIDFYVLLCDV
jgi:hypothetical protein